MIKVTAENIEYKVPACWNDLTFSKWLLISKETDSMNILSILTGMNLDVLNRISLPSQIKLVAVISFLNDEIDFDSIEIPPKLGGVEYVQAIGKKTYQNKIDAHEVMKKADKQNVSFFPELIDIYQPNVDFNSVGVLDVYATGLGYCNQMNDIVQKESDTLSVQPTVEQVNAGIDIYTKFGVMNTIRALSGGDILNYDKVLALEYNVVYITLLMNKADSVFQENYRKVVSRK
ncbi:MAG: hypothetical protein HRT87_01240 [Legionellales bacterium]|nr:hypothetical protein [Legionellales bacterium]